MSEPIQPALTAEQWAEGSKEVRVDGRLQEALLCYDPPGLGVSDNNFTASSVTHPDVLCAAIALANAALPDGDPRKITREWVDAIRAAAATEDEYGDVYADGVTKTLVAVADALASYLPPEAE